MLSVPSRDLEKPCKKVFYLPMHTVTKTSSLSTRLYVVLNASTKSKSGVLLNDSLLLGPTVHAPLLDILLWFRCHKVVLSADIRQMYGALLLSKNQCNYHRFVWKTSPQDFLTDYRMTRLMFGDSASFFTANMAQRECYFRARQAHWGKFDFRDSECTKKATRAVQMRRISPS